MRTKTKTKGEVLTNLRFIKDTIHEVFGAAKEYKVDRPHGKTRELYKLNEKGKLDGMEEKTNDVGLLVTERFYILFPWERCVDEIANKVHFDKLTGVFELAHGSSTVIFTKHTPFDLPAGHNWEINWVGPFGSVASGNVKPRVINDRVFATSKIDTTGKVAKGVHVMYDSDSTTPITKEFANQCMAPTGKFSNPLKYISGTNKHIAKIRNLSLYKFTLQDLTFQGHREDMIGLVRATTTLAGVISRSRILKTVYLSDLLKGLSKWGFPTKLVVSSCRGFSENPPVWSESNNLGPKSWFALGQDNVQNWKHPTRYGAVSTEYK